MKRQQGFTLVEIAIVLVIIGLLLGGVLKGQELINSAKVKNFANDFRSIPLFIYGYQDKFKSLPGDDTAASTHVSGGTNASTPATKQGNAVIDGNWDSTTATDESFLFWQHVRLANLAAGPTDTTAADYAPKNADGGRIGIESGAGAYIDKLTGTYVICSTGILGKYAKQLDVTMDDGNTATGSMRTVTTGHTRGDAAPAQSSLVDADAYTVCLGV